MNRQYHQWNALDVAELSSDLAESMKTGAPSSYRDVRESLLYWLESAVPHQLGGGGIVEDLPRGTEQRDSGLRDFLKPEVEMLLRWLAFGRVLAASLPTRAETNAPAAPGKPPAATEEEKVLAERLKPWLSDAERLRLSIAAWALGQLEFPRPVDSYFPSPIASAQGDTPEEPPDDGVPHNDFFHAGIDNAAWSLSGPDSAVDGEGRFLALGKYLGTKAAAKYVLNDLVKTLTHNCREQAPAGSVSDPIDEVRIEEMPSVHRNPIPIVLGQPAPDASSAIRRSNRLGSGHRLGVEHTVDRGLIQIQITAPRCDFDFSEPHQPPPQGNAQQDTRIHPWTEFLQAVNDWLPRLIPAHLVCRVHYLAPWKGASRLGGKVFRLGAGFTIGAHLTDNSGYGLTTLGATKQ